MTPCISLSLSQSLFKAKLLRLHSLPTDPQQHQPPSATSVPSLDALDDMTGEADEPSALSPLEAPLHPLLFSTRKLDDACVITINSQFHSPSRKVMLHIAAQKETTEEHKSTMSAVTEDRKFAIQVRTSRVRPLHLSFTLIYVYVCEIRLPLCV